MATSTKLPELLDRALSGDVPRGWLFLPEEPRAWGTDTDAYVIAKDEEVAEADDRSYCAIVENQTLEDIVRAARSVLNVDSFAGRLEALTYYYRFDAFLPRLGAPDPPRPQEIRQRLDREFYYSLGPERAAVPCREPGCRRGAVAFSALCKVHHFQQIQRRPCPFVD